jgi:hypothetical protein
VHEACLTRIVDVVVVDACRDDEPAIAFHPVRSLTDQI